MTLHNSIGPYTECHYAGCYAFIVMLNVVMLITGVLSVVMLYVVMLNVILISVAAPISAPRKNISKLKETVLEHDAAKSIDQLIINEKRSHYNINEPLFFHCVGLPYFLTHSRSRSTLSHAKKERKNERERGRRGKRERRLEVRVCSIKLFCYYNL
jgi:hypothetical protein